MSATPFLSYPPSALSIRTEVDTHRLRIVLGGELDLAGADQVASVGRRGLALASVRVLALDLAAISSIDAGALRRLVELRRLAIGRGKRFELADPPPDIASALRVGGLDLVYTAGS
jgi:anti-anti-sigma factor